MPLRAIRRLSQLAAALLSATSLLAAQTSIPVVPLTISAPADAPEPGVSHALAIARAARVSDLHYALSYKLVAKISTTEAHEILSFNDSGTGDLPIDFRDGDLRTATLNGHELLTQTVNGHLILSAAALVKGPNKLELAFTANIAPAGKAITRYQDKDDGAEYLYTLFVPMDADMAFPCFDQPDLKARFSLTVSAPPDWTVIANTTAATAIPGRALSSVIDPHDPNKQHTFPETRPISTYLFAFAAGPFQRIPPKNPGEPALYVRKSQLKRAQAEAPAVQTIAARGIHYLETFFAQPFPFPKYDLVLIPGFPFGGMEHAGATFLNEDGVLFRSAPTQADFFRRDILVLHETTHQWFGDLVTMRWFDDLWLKEGFAQYMAYKAMAVLKPETEPWKHFYEDIKPLAYGIDETQGTTPIFQQIPNLKDAKSAYGAIVYQKAPAVLKQLNFKLGDDTFRDGLRIYLKQHAYANATWPDLIHAFTEAGGKQVQPWADAWILRRGMPQVDASFTCAQGVVTDLTLTQKDVLPDNFTWPIANEVLLPVTSSDILGPHGGGKIALRVDWNTPTFTVEEAIGKPCPRYIFANFADQAYGRFLLDPVSEKAVVHLLTPATNPGAPGLASETWAGAPMPSDPLLHSQLWGALWDNVQTARTSPLTYVDLARPALFVEEDESLIRIHGARIATAFHAYMSPQSKATPLDRVEGTLMARMSLSGSPQGRGTPGIRITAFRAFTSISETPRALQVLKDLLSGSVTIEGVPLKPLDRWNIIGHLIAQHDPEAQTLFLAEQQKDHSGEAQKYAYAVQAATPDAPTKQRYWNDYLHNATLQEDWITQSLGSFNSWNQSSLTLPYLADALNQLPDIKLHRKIFFLGAWLSSFINGQHTPEAQAIVHTWLAQPNIDPDLRLKVLEASDALDRTVQIRKTYPD